MFEHMNHTLLEHHVQDLKLSGLTDKTIEAAGLFSETDFGKLAGLLNRKKYGRKNGPALVFPYHDETGAVVLHRIKPDNPPQNGNGHVSKYIGPTGVPSRVYFPPGVYTLLADPGASIFITEGEKKSLRGMQDGLACIGLSGVECWHEKKSSALLPDLGRIQWQGRPTYIVFDSDAADNENVRTAESLLAAVLASHGAAVKIVRLPPGPDGAKMGLDDYLVAHGIDAFWQLVSQATEAEAVEPELLKQPAAKLFPEKEASRFLQSVTIDNQPRLTYWKETFWYWTRGRYGELPESEVRARLIEYLNRGFVQVGRTAIGNVLEQLRAQSFLTSRIEPPAWLGKTKRKDWAPHDLLVCKNAIVHLPSLFESEDHTIPPTPALFATTGLDFDFIPGDECPRPDRWLSFLDELWPDDRESIEALQLWFGYCIVPDCRQHKMVCLFGPKRGGKTTLARILCSLVGRGNVAAPTLSSFSTNFGLWPLAGKTLAVIGDARLSGRSDAAVIAERLLSITGQDPLTIDRKFLPPVTMPLPCRIMMLSNELPRLSDASGTLVSRMIVLRLTQSWYGREDIDLMGRLEAELSGVMWWAIEGWRKLQERRRLLQPASGAEAVAELEDLASPVGCFLRERCRVSPELSIKRSTLHEGYAEFCKEMGRKHVLDDAAFGRDLQSLIPTLRTERPKIFGKRERHYGGLTLQDEGVLG